MLIYQGSLNELVKFSPESIVSRNLATLAPLSNSGDLVNFKAIGKGREVQNILAR